MASRRNFLIGLLTVVFLGNTVFADVASQAYPLRIKVLSAEFHSINTSTPVPQDCDLPNFSAYCNNSKNPSVRNIMLVEDGSGSSFSITCTVDSRWSKCISLPVGQTFEARKEKHGITVLYQNAKGKQTKQFYHMVVPVPEPHPGAVAAAPPEVRSTVVSSPAPPPAQTSAPVPAPAPAVAPVVRPVQQEPVQTAEKVEKIKCNFSSTPPGAEITLDGKYVGSTPSEIPVSAGTHVVVFSLAGFTQWKRDLTVVSGSELTVSAILQKEQP
jgi:hypothetical protein